MAVERDLTNINIESVSCSNLFSFMNNCVLHSIILKKDYIWMRIITISMCVHTKYIIKYLDYNPLLSKRYYVSQII